MVEVGQKLPDAEVLLVGEDGQEAVRIADYLASKKVAIFAMPGAFTSTCSSSHLPNVIRHKDGLYEKGVDDVVILVVNDPFVVREWAKHSGAFAADLTMIADAGSVFTTALGMNFSAEAIGFCDRSQRYALLSENGVVSKFFGRCPWAGFILWRQPSFGADVTPICQITIFGRRNVQETKPAHHGCSASHQRGCKH